MAWFTIEDLDALVRKHRPDDSVAKAIDRIIRTDMIIVDDIGLPPVSTEAAEGFYRLVDAAYGRRSLAVSSNLHPSGFDEIMPKRWPPPSSTGSCAMRHTDLSKKVGVVGMRLPLIDILDWMTNTSYLSSR